MAEAQAQPYQDDFLAVYLTMPYRNYRYPARLGRRTLVERE